MEQVNTVVKRPRGRPPLEGDRKLCSNCKRTRPVEFFEGGRKTCDKCIMRRRARYAHKKELEKNICDC